MEATKLSLTVTPGLLLLQTYGTSMWPALRAGDLLFGHPLGEAERPAVGSILVVDSFEGLMAHRLARRVGAHPRERFHLAGDLSGPDGPFERQRVRGVAVALYRRGVGFLDIPAPLEFGPLGRRVVSRLALVWTWAQARRSAPGPQLLF